MNNEEALYLINSRRNSTLLSVDLEALDSAIESMEKQIPMKPVIKDTLYCCPHCGSNIRVPVISPYNYCCYCGQAIDRSDNNVCKKA